MAKSEDGKVYEQSVKKEDTTVKEKAFEVVTENQRTTAFNPTVNLRWNVIEKKFLFFFKTKHGTLQQEWVGANGEYKWADVQAFIA